MIYKTVLITGGTGSLGQSIAKNFLSNKKYKKIIIFSRDELKQSEMKKKFTQKEQQRLRFFIGDVRDLSRLIIACENVDIMVHAAALKQVDTAEYNPIEYIKTNIYGAQNVIEASYVKNIKKVIALSTDKASSPVNLYGATKLCSDKLFIAASNYLPKTIFSVIKYGNVVSSRGSVIPMLIKQADKNQAFTITDTNMTRFSLELNKCLEIIKWSIQNSFGGEVIIPKLKSYRILDLVKSISSKQKIKIIGVRSGEKLNEEMISIHEARYCYDIGSYYIIIPNMQNKIINYYKKKFKAKIVKKDFEYNSKINKHFLSARELKKIIDKY